jgi:hypothetical protein
MKCSLFITPPLVSFKQNEKEGELNTVKEMDYAFHHDIWDRM